MAMADLPAALAYAAVILVLAGCCAYAYSIQAGHEQLDCLRFPVRAARCHRIRRRYARRMRGPLPARDQDIPYSRRQWLAILDAWEAPAAPAERSRT